jgi:hypothetical protein
MKVQSGCLADSARGPGNEYCLSAHGAIKTQSWVT